MKTVTGISRTSHIIHFILTVFTGGCWGVVWFFHWFFARRVHKTS